MAGAEDWIVFLFYTCCGGVGEFAFPFLVFMVVWVCFLFFSLFSSAGRVLGLLDFPL